MLPPHSSENLKKYYKRRKWKWRPKRLIAGIAFVVFLFLLIIFSFYYVLKELPSSISNAFDQSKSISKPIASKLVNEVQQTDPISQDHSFAIGVANSQLPESSVETTESKPTVITNPLPVLIFTFNRPQNLRKTLESVLNVRPSKDRFPILVSQDGNDQSVNEVIENFDGKIEKHLKFEFREPNYYEFPSMKTYYKIAQHYGFALKKVFDELNYKHVILLEDDMLVSPDFFSYFAALSPIVERDPSLFCASGWNDRGQERFVRSHSQLYRTECFPGLGWLLTESIWQELRSKWPYETGFWDDWLRLPEQRKGRSCVYPEINRVYTFGSVGSSGGQFFEEYLRGIELNNMTIDWESEIMKPHLQVIYQTEYKGLMGHWIKTAKTVDSISTAQNEIEKKPLLPPWILENDLKEQEEIPSYVVLYNSMADLTPMLQSVGLMGDPKAGISRSSWKGVVIFRHNGYRILLVPSNSELR